MTKARFSAALGKSLQPALWQHGTGSVLLSCWLGRFPRSLRSWELPDIAAAVSIEVLTSNEHLHHQLLPACT